MITETGRVVAVSGDRVWVQTIRTSACESCSARNGCGQRALAGVSGGRANQVLVANSLDARVGDEVTVAIEESALVGASLLVYALPLALLVVGAVAGHQLSGGHDAAAMLGAATGMATGFMVARRIGSNPARGYEPRLVKVRQELSGPGS
ncbi:SoxR reducing system RseC family protein [Marinobacter orientalis]|uniref:SoxR reducing system RseC family protein n=1 Tax=Marinobacter orientalis TaxID=1928859 RepID=A0A7Y0RDC8_9GAMM|nr:SoxR reducing system RseC family protein [Marinobacter orientalis]NMT64159.1 SoxR reducing system RseC family protein [Marinobacter orientalis]TGX49386.1 sigma E positive regulator RseC/MucC [Marinobacter orientalis]